MQDVAIEDWWQDVSAARAGELMAFWAASDAGVAANEASERATQAVCVARDAGGALVGVSTAQPKLIPFLGEWMFYFRAFVAPSQRGSLVGLSLLQASKRCLNAAHAAASGRDRTRPIGLFLELENPMLSRDDDRAVWKRTGMIYAGQTPRGLDRRIWYFDDALLSRPGAKSR